MNRRPTDISEKGLETLIVAALTRRISSGRRAKSASTPWTWSNPIEAAEHKLGERRTP